MDKKKRSETLDLIGHVPFGVAGIYSITNRLTGQVYVGSALCVRGRWATHIWRLRRGNHHSRRLQGAWTRDGETQFAFALLEQVTAEQHLLTIEQAWINFLRAYAPRGGYNTSPLAGSTRGIKKTPDQIERHRQQMHESAHPYFVKHPDGRTELVPNIGLFAQANGLSASNLRRVGAGQQAMHKGYWCRKATEQERRSFLA
ncbi:GIY-YIG catalytic domain containing protein [Deinococcus grandis]|uniref:GIY-YIG catalytic domain containing protein n=1 Tax=Deinococcus grandis TaxID=57498 RepID=A0A100HQP6_9DEIO|nr:GIY-YIG catalytic domain containing protein [Deinococcus grandis]